MTRQVFISHSATDRAAAEAIRTALETAGLACWIAPRDIPAGTPWAAAIMAGIAEVRAVLLIHSAASATSAMVLREVNAAIDAKTPVIPVRIDPTPVQDSMQFYLGSTHWLDASAGALQNHLVRIVAAVTETFGHAVAPIPLERPALALPDRPSIAVLPFQNMSGDPEQEYFADGLVDEIITGLSRFRHLFVIARNSSFTYKGRAVDVKQVGRDLGVRYVLEGSVRKAASRVRITAQLIDAATGAHLWADRFDGQLEEIFDLQDRITENVVSAITPALEKAELRRTRHKATLNLDAYDRYLHGMALRALRIGGRENNDAALRHFRDAISLDPDYAAAYGMAAHCMLNQKTSGWWTDPVAETAEALRLARRAVALGGDDDVALAIAGTVLAHMSRDLDAGLQYGERAYALNPNSLTASLYSGWMQIWSGNPAAAIERFSRSLRLSPLDPYLPGMQNGIAHAHFFAGRYDEAASWASAALREWPNFHDTLRIAAASHAMAGYTAQAAEAIARLRELDPSLRVSMLRELQGPYRREQDSALYEGALRRAGLPG